MIFSDSATYVSTVTGGTVGADSTQLTGVGAIDSTTKLIAIEAAPVNKALRGPVNGWGNWCRVYPVGLNASVAIGSVHDVIMPEFMRVLVTPLRRSTGATVSATVPNRTNGLKGFRLEAYIYRKNR